MIIEAKICSAAIAVIKPLSGQNFGKIPETSSKKGDYFIVDYIFVFSKHYCKDEQVLKTQLFTKGLGKEKTVISFKIPIHCVHN